jgi:serine protease Do
MVVTTPDSNVPLKDRSMSARSLNWLKFGGLVALAFALGLLFAGLLDLPNRTSAQEQARGTATIAQVPAPSIPAARPLQDLSESFAAVAEHVKPSVVYIRSQRTERAAQQQRVPPGMERFFPRFRQQPEIEQGSGSGFVVSADGYILTNNHVVEGAEQVTVRLLDRREFKAKVIGTDPNTDVAVLKIDATKLPPKALGNSDDARVGEWVLAIGNPLGEGLTFTVTSGIVSAKGRALPGLPARGQGSIQDFIQTDAAINPGNSGGALVNTAGELVGINTAIISQTGGYQGVGFAVPASMAKPVMESLVKTGKVVRGYLGVGIQDLTQDLAKSFGVKSAKGALVGNVAEDSPAERAGLKQGDVIVAYQGKPIEDPGALQRDVTRTAVGTKATVKIIRDGHEQELTVTIGEQSEAAKVASTDPSMENALAGMEVQNLDRQLARELGLSGKVQGVVVVNVEPDSQADRAGLAQGDVIQQINRHPVKSVKDYEKIAAGLKKDQQALLLINRRGASLFITVKA